MTWGSATLFARQSTQPLMPVRRAALVSLIQRRLDERKKPMFNCSKGTEAWSLAHSQMLVLHHL